MLQTTIGRQGSPDSAIGHWDLVMVIAPALVAGHFPARPFPALGQMRSSMQTSLLESAGLAGSAAALWTSGFAAAIGGFGGRSGLVAAAGLAAGRGEAGEPWRRCSSFQPADIFPPAIELILRQRVLARDLVLKLLGRSFDLHVHRQPAVLFIAKADFDRRLGRQIGRQMRGPSICQAASNRPATGSPLRRSAPESTSAPPCAS